MRKVGKLAAQLLDLFVDEVKPGITTESLDCFAYEFIKDNGAIPAPLNYRGFKKSICTSIRAEEIKSFVVGVIIKNFLNFWF